MNKTMGNGFVFILMLILSVTGCTPSERTLNALSPRPPSHQLVSRDTHRLQDGKADVLVYKIPVGGTLCSDNGGGICAFWDGFTAQFDVFLHQRAHSVDAAKEKAIEALDIHCRPVRRCAQPVITEASADFVRFQNGCHPF